ncbi:shikimate kinase [Paenibacillus aestuarii]|uniref:Shikimate kinase n=1 Tax=Paenibacillus aestuarii TaxID=516965 RepID=A0ABW0KI57_9BACL|nr:shikimate kinase [Paenibacillus aestuarii]
MITNNIVLVGFMGTGKSTVGRLLAERLGWNFLDSDAEIEKNEQTSIAEIFRLHGEAHFRQLESQALADILAGSGQVLATGGGAVLAETNRTCMLGSGCVVALQATPEKIIARVSSDQSRPLLQGNLEERVHALMETRKSAYDFATMAIDTTELTVEQIVEEIIARTGLNQKEGQA